MLVDDMKSRRVEDGEGADDPKKVLVYNVRTSSWDVIPRHLGVYMLGFPLHSLVDETLTQKGFAGLITSQH